MGVDNVAIRLDCGDSDSNEMNHVTVLERLGQRNMHSTMMLTGYLNSRSLTRCLYATQY